MLSNAQRSDLIQELVRAQRELDLLMFDDVISGLRNPPATEKQVSAYERDCGFSLPPGFREFLLMHNGWPDFLGDAAILGTEWRTEEWVDEALDGLEAPFDEFGQEDPIAGGAVPVLLGQDAFVSVFLWPPKANTGRFHEYQYSEKIMEHPDFDDFLTSSLESLLNQIREEREGSSKADEDGP